MVAKKVTWMEPALRLLPPANTYGQSETYRFPIFPHVVPSPVLAEAMCKGDKEKMPHLEFTRYQRRLDSGLVIYLWVRIK